MDQYDIEGMDNALKKLKENRDVAELYNIIDDVVAQWETIKYRHNNPIPKSSSYDNLGT